MIIDLSAIVVAVLGVLYGWYNSRQAKRALQIPVEQGAYDRAKLTLTTVIDEQDEKIRELYDEAKEDRAELIRLRATNRQLVIQKAEQDVEIAILRERLDEMDKLIRELQNRPTAS